MEQNDSAEYSGIDCYADDRDAFNDFAKYFNNQHLSDVLLMVGDEQFAAHKIVLCRSSEVFDRMLSKRWNKETLRELKLSEDSTCQPVFSSFLRFLYCNHIVLNDKNVLPLLVLADKYCVHGMRKICVEYASKHILPFVNLNCLIDIWFKYSTTAYHKDLTRECVQKISKHLWHIISDEEWKDDWLSLDRDQLIELLKSSDLVVPNEFVLYEAVQKWFNSPQHPHRRGQGAKALVQEVLQLIRFPFLTADELDFIEKSCPIAKEHPDIICAQTHLAFKYLSMPLSRASSDEFTGIQFLCRNYTDIRWDKRLTIPTEQLKLRPAEHRFNITTRSSTFPLQNWDWELAFIQSGGNLSTSYSITSSNRSLPDDLTIELKGVDIDQQRSVEYVIMIINDKQVLKTFSGKKTFTKSRTTEILELENRLTVDELFGERSLASFQLTLRPIS